MKQCRLLPLIAMLGFSTHTLAVSQLKAALMGILASITSAEGNHKKESCRIYLPNKISLQKCLKQNKNLQSEWHQASAAPMANLLALTELSKKQVDHSSTALIASAIMHEALPAHRPDSVYSMWDRILELSANVTKAVLWCQISPRIYDRQKRKHQLAPIFFPKASQLKNCLHNTTATQGPWYHDSKTIDEASDLLALRCISHEQLRSETKNVVAIGCLRDAVLEGVPISTLLSTSASVNDRALDLYAAAQECQITRDMYRLHKKAKRR